MKRHALRLLLAAAMAALTLSVVSAAAGDPRPERDKSRAVLLIHGYKASGRADCVRTWGKAVRALRNAGWTGPLTTVGYYAGDRRCDARVSGRYGTNASIVTLGRALARHIYTHYSKHDRIVDIVSHSMGGLVARTAITGVQRKWAGFPPYLFVEDAVTLGTPHRGVKASWVCRCGNRQCVQMRPGSKFLRTLARHQNPQTIGGTDWTLIGSAADGTVAARSACKTPKHDADHGPHAGGMRAAHHVGYRPSAGISHGELRTVTGHGNYPMLWRNHGGRWHTKSLGRSPVLAAGFAITYSTRW